MKDIPASDDDAELLVRVARQDRDAFAQLYDRYSAVLYSMAYRILNDRTESSDVLQDVFLQIWGKANTFDPRLGRPFNWAVTLTRNRAIDRLRALRRRYSFIEEVQHEMADDRPRSSAGDTEIFNREKVSRVRAAVETLPLEQRQAIEMAFLGGMTQYEISRALDQPLGTIKARIRRGMLKMRDTLKDLT